MENKRKKLLGNILIIFNEIEIKLIDMALNVSMWRDSLNISDTISGIAKKLDYSTASKICLFKGITNEKMHSRLMKFKKSRNNIVHDQGFFLEFGLDKKKEQASLKKFILKSKKLLKEGFQLHEELWAIQEKYEPEELKKYTKKDKKKAP